MDKQFPCLDLILEIICLSPSVVALPIAFSQPLYQLARHLLFQLLFFISSALSVALSVPFSVAIISSSISSPCQFISTPDTHNNGIVEQCAGEDDVDGGFGG